MIATATPKVTESLLVRICLIVVALLFLILVLIVPLVTILASALAKGFSVYWSSISEPDARSAIWLTLVASAISVPCNLVFGLAASWAIAKFDFAGKKLLMTLIDLPFTVSPVISGLIFVLLFGAQGWFGGLMSHYDIKILFAVPGIVLATIFVTFPYVARSLIPLMQVQGNDQEEAGLTLGAGGWRTFWHITLPNIKWGLLYGVILLNARAMGEFGAIPLHVEILYNEYQFAGAFAMASILTILAVVTLIVKTYVKWKTGEENV
jgi:sulfate/thiosulfate transport system permease protein